MADSGNIMHRDNVEEGKMLEPGNVRNTANGEYTTYPIHNRISNPTKATTPIKIADDDAAAAAILNPLHEQDPQKDSRNAEKV